MFSVRDIYGFHTFFVGGGDGGLGRCRAVLPARLVLISGC